jgi:flagellum-specific ATP synthase
MRHTNIVNRLASARSLVKQRAPLLLHGQVVAVAGLALDIAGLGGHVSVGDRVTIASREGPPVVAEIIGFRAGMAQAMPFGALDGLGPGSQVRASGAPAVPGRARAVSGQGGALAVGAGWLGRVIDPLGRPLDGRGKLPEGPNWRSPRGQAPDATLRARLGPRLDLGVRALDCFVTCRQGQRLGLFAGSGIGKSTLLAMMARQSAAEIIVLALVGERGREVREFLEDELGAEGLARAVVVVATSDAPPLLRRQAAYTAMTVAEHFRDEGRSVLLMMDSVTRFCLALREIGLSAGEPPATRGYPPSVFAELPRLLERAGPGYPLPDGSAGFITALFTVLVEGDDHNEPVADTVRGILDGHVILDRRIAEAGRYPAIDVLRSLSRSMPGCNLPAETALVRRARAVLALHADMADMIRLGAYRRGSDPAVDEAMALAPRIEAFLHQNREEVLGPEDSFAGLGEALSLPAGQEGPHG